MQNLPLYDIASREEVSDEMSISAVEDMISLESFSGHVDILWTSGWSSKILTCRTNLKCALHQILYTWCALEGRAGRL